LKIESSCRFFLMQQRAHLAAQQAILGVQRNHLVLNGAFPVENHTTSLSHPLERLLAVFVQAEAFDGRKRSQVARLTERFRSRLATLETESVVAGFAVEQTREAVEQLALVAFISTLQRLVVATKQICALAIGA
jgi:hypothetical protein